jgi:hypothetical protein
VGVGEDLVKRVCRLELGVVSMLMVGVIAGCPAKSSLKPAPDTPSRTPATVTNDSRTVLGAMVAVAYWRDHDFQTTDDRLRAVLAPDSAVDVLLRDQSFGANTRRWYAYTFLKDRHPTEAEKIRQHLKANNCAPMVTCQLRYAASDAMAALRFQFQIPMTLDQGAEILDPQNWDELDGSYFELVGRRRHETCPAEGSAPPPKDLLSSDVGDTWKDTVYERFHVPQEDITFQHVLYFDSYRPNRSLYCLGYRVCPGLKYPNKLWEADRSVDSGMSEDDGCSWIVDLRGPDIQVNAIKRLTLSPELCVNPPHDCNPELMGIGLEILAIETSVAFARVLGQESESCQVALCDEVEDLDNYTCKSEKLNMPAECDIETRVHSLFRSK